MVRPITPDDTPLRKVLGPTTLVDLHGVKRVHLVALHRDHAALEFRGLRRFPLRDGNRVLGHSLLRHVRSQHADDERHLRHLVFLPHVLHEVDHVVLVVVAKGR